MDVRVKHSAARIWVPAEGPLGHPIVKQFLRWAGVAVLILGGLVVKFGHPL